MRRTSIIAAIAVAIVALVTTRSQTTRRHSTIVRSAAAHDVSPALASLVLATVSAGDSLDDDAIDERPRSDTSLRASGAGNRADRSTGDDRAAWIGRDRANSTRHETLGRSRGQLRRAGRQLCRATRCGHVSQSV